MVKKVLFFSTLCLELGKVFYILKSLQSIDASHTVEVLLFVFFIVFQVIFTM